MRSYMPKRIGRIRPAPHQAIKPSKKFSVADHELPVRKPGFIMDTTKDKDMTQGFTLVMAFSRLWCIQNFFAYFNRMKFNIDKCHILVIDNSDMPVVGDKLVERMDKYRHSFASVRVYKTWRTGATDNIMDPKQGFTGSKLPFIYKLQRDICRMITTEKFVLLEDDTLAPPDTIMRLLTHLEENPKAGVVTALETGRSLACWERVRLGALYVKRDDKRLLWMISPSPWLRGLHKVDGCGWYAVASYKDVWEKGFKGMKNYLEDIPRFALDVIHTNNIKRLGYDILADFDCWCIHMQSTATGIYFYKRGQASPVMDIWIPEFETYAQRVMLKKPCHAKMLKNLVRMRDKQ